MYLKYATDYIEKKGGSRAVQDTVLQKQVVNAVFGEITSFHPFSWTRRIRSVTIPVGQTIINLPWDFSIPRYLTNADSESIPRVTPEEWYELKSETGSDDTVRGMIEDVTVEPHYKAGTVDMATNGAITGYGTTFTSDMVGMAFRIDGETKKYEIGTFTDVTHIVATETRDSAVTGQSYQINPNPISRMRVVPTATTAITATLIYHREHPYLIKDNDYSIIPDKYDWVILLGLDIKLLEYDSRFSMQYYKKVEEFTRRGMALMIRDDSRVKHGNRLHSFRRLQDVKEIPTHL